MAGAIKSHHIKDLDLFRSSESSRTLRICKEHKLQLIDEIANDINDIVQTQFFQKNFKEFLPEGKSGADLYIRVSKDKILVRKLDSTASTPAPEKTVDVDEETGELSLEIIQKANCIYRRCHSDSAHRRSDSVDDRDYSPVDRGRHHYSDSFDDRSSHFGEPRRSTHRRRSDSDIHARSSRHDSRASSLGRQDARSRSPDRSYDVRDSRPVHYSPSHRRHAGRLDEQDDDERSSPRSRHPHFSDAPREIDSLGSVLTGSDRTSLQQQLSSLERQYDRALTAHRTSLEELTALKRDIDALRQELSSRIAMHPNPEIERLRAQLQSTEQELARLHSTHLAPRSVVSAATQTPHLTPEQLGVIKALANDFPPTAELTSTEIPPALLKKFRSLPKKVQNQVFFQIYILHLSPKPAPWKYGEHCFLNAEGFTATNLVRKIALTNVALLAFAEELATLPNTPSEAMMRERLAQIPEDMQGRLFVQLEFKKQDPAINTREKAQKAFFEQEGYKATNAERISALERTVEENILFYHQLLLKHHLKEQERNHH